MTRPTARRMLALGAVTAAISAGAIAAPVFANAATGATSAPVPGSTNSLFAAATPAAPDAHGHEPDGGMRQAFDAAVAHHLGIATTTFTAAEDATRAALRPATRPTTPPDPRAAEMAFTNLLANKLGVTSAALTAAEDVANQETILAQLSSMVADGHITQHEATALRAAATNGTFDTVLRTQRIAHLTAHVNADVAAGRVTRAQADAILAAARTAPLFGPGAGPGGPGGPGGPHGMCGPDGHAGPPPGGTTGPNGPGIGAPLGGPGGGPGHEQPV